MMMSPGWHYLGRVHARLIYLIYRRTLAYLVMYVTLGRCPLSIFCSRGTLPAWAYTPVDVMDENPLGQPTLSLSTPFPSGSYLI